MQSLTLLQFTMLLIAAAVAAPIARLLRIGSIVGYLLAGIALGPYGLGQAFSTYEAKEILHVAEFGVVLLLFLIGLELRVTRLWSMRQAIFGAGAAQVLLTATAIAAMSDLFSMSTAAAIFAGLALSLSSTAMALQLLDENGELTTQHGRLGFAILLFQDLAAIPLIALAPLFAASLGPAGRQFDTGAILQALVIVAVVLVVGRYVIDRVLRIIARAKVKEAMTAAALLTVVGVAGLMQQAGLSASLGAFLAGVLLAESSYRHQLEADLKPFEGLLLGLFFTAIGMSLDVSLLASMPRTMMTLALALVVIKIAVLYVVGRRAGLEPRAARRLGLVLSQGGEFAFVVFTVGAAAGVLGRGEANVFALVVTLSMLMTPLLLLIDSKLTPKPATALKAFDELPEADGHVIIAGFGRFGQVIARVLRAKNIPFTALDISPEQVELVKRFGADAFYGDVSRLEILEAAQAGKARAFVLAIDDIEASIRTVQLVHAHYPGLAIYARARNRVHAHRLLDAGVKKIIRETFHSSIEMTEALLRGLGMSNLEARRTVRVFQAHDERRLIEDYQYWTDEQKLRERAQSSVVTLQQLLEEDTVEQAVADGTASPRKRLRKPVADGRAEEPAIERSVAKDARETTS